MKNTKQLFAIILFFNLFYNNLAQPCKEIIGYYPNWQWYDRAKLVKASTINYSKYSIINYCFFKPELNGTISSTDTWADENLLQGQINWNTFPVSYYPNTSIIDLAHNAGTKVFVSIGGWTLSDNFPSIAANASLRAKFASECNRLIKFYHFDGIDIDWEYPGYAPHSGTPNDKVNFTLFLQQIRDSLNALGIIQGKTYKLSACFSADQVKMQDIQWNNVVPILDMINVMSYDFFGAWDCVANHNSPLYATPTGDPTFNVNSAFLKLKNIYNVPPLKINLGIAFYGRSQMGASGLYQTTNCNDNSVLFSDDLGSPLYYNIVKNMNLFNRFWDNVAQVPYLMGKSSTTANGTFVSYDDKQSIGLKANYIKSNNARGAIIWEITGDYMETSPGSGIIAGTPLVDTLNQVFCNLSTNINQLHENAHIVIFPNPTSGSITMTAETNILYINVTDPIGRVIIEKYPTNEKSVQLLLESKGIFLISINTDSGRFCKKILVQ